MTNIIYSIGAISICLALGYCLCFFIGGIPASLYGMLLLTLGLSTRIINPDRLEKTIKWAIKNIGICFVPAAVGIVEYIYLLKIYGLSITLIVVLTTVLLLTTVGYYYQRSLSSKSPSNDVKP